MRRSKYVFYPLAIPFLESRDIMTNMLRQMNYLTGTYLAKTVQPSDALHRAMMTVHQSRISHSTE